MLEERGAGGVAEAGIVIAGMGLGGLVFTTTLKRLMAAVGTMFNIIRIGGVVAAIGFVGVAMAGSWQFETGAFVLLGFGFYAVHSSLQTQATELAPDNRGAAVALHAFFFFLGHAAGPPLYALSFGIMGQAATILTLGLIVCLGSFVLASALQQRSD